MTRSVGSRESGFGGLKHRSVSSKEHTFKPRIPIPDSRSPRRPLQRLIDIREDVLGVFDTD